VRYIFFILIFRNDQEKENSNAKKSNGGTEDDDPTGKQKLPKAMVKPQVLTHVIEGFVIQEAAEPFPISKATDLDEPPSKFAVKAPLLQSLVQAAT